MSDFLSVDEAAARLGVKPATLYAYVSRGLLQRTRGPHGRSQFARADIDRLATSGRPRGVDVTEIAVHSAITSIDGDHIYFRGRDALDLADERRFEEVAEWLWLGQFPDGLAWAADARAVEIGRRVQDALPAETLPLDRLRIAVTSLAPSDTMRYETGREAVVVTGRRLISSLVDCLPVNGAAGGETSPLAARLWRRLARRAPRPDQVRILDAALVILVDYELSLSTLASRLAASILADPYAVISVGLSALGGPLHAVASLAAEDLLAEVGESGDAAVVIGERLRRGDRLPGFGHRLHPQGDPRAAFLLGRLERAERPGTRMEAVRAVLAATRERGLPPPNVDFALAALAHISDMARGASEAVFAVARTAGWIAHALEAYALGAEIRPRAIYVGTSTGPER
ncbi:MAG TPA: citrate synthase [Chloroflexota bacterium]|nr:citrate synthase [Chloroflexota bacterium]